MQVTNLIGIVIPQKLKYEELKQQSIDKQRFAFFKGDTHAWVDETRAESDTHVYWACNACVPKWNNKTGMYLKREASAGCTYDKATKKFKWWFGKNAVINGPNLVKDMCDYFKAEWFTNSPLGLQNSTTNSISRISAFSRNWTKNISSRFFHFIRNALKPLETSQSENCLPRDLA